jgi:hypothetical protein
VNHQDRIGEAKGGKAEKGEASEQQFTDAERVDTDQNHGSYGLNSSARAK